MKTNLFFRAFLDYKFLIMTGVLAVSISACTSPSSAPEQDSSVNRPSGGSVSSIPEGTPGTHTVKPGETLYMIARQYSVSPSSLIAWNGLANPNQITA